MERFSPDISVLLGDLNLDKISQIKANAFINKLQAGTQVPTIEREFKGNKII